MLNGLDLLTEMLISFPNIAYPSYLAFVNATEYGNFTSAPEALNFTHSGISRIINDLESEWGILLLNTPLEQFTLKECFVVTFSILQSLV